METDAQGTTALNCPFRSLTEGDHAGERKRSQECLASRAACCSSASVTMQSGLQQCLLGNSIVRYSNACRGAKEESSTTDPRQTLPCRETAKAPIHTVPVSFTRSACSIERWRSRTTQYLNAVSELSNECRDEVEDPQTQTSQAARTWAACNAWPRA